ncbi:type II toxin-antitoxin system RelE/ParE family toxin [Mesorhizobium sp. B2-3-13]|uniref:type II toxin-antitoxin system RelE/ParE family toxin n=1 Tax=Mesorhizobium sp. B2-3-13 TaxID=2589951 RepID=UPI001FEF7073|nr:type II toxin-antitoxin system RelE/ParE family toxin [Mesorhizobium sp. B2-3-13]
MQLLIQRRGAAVRLVDALERRWDLLTLHPFSGAPRDDIAPGIRHLIVGEYLTLYRSAVMRSKFFACCMVVATSKPMTSARRAIPGKRAAPFPGKARSAFPGGIA